MKTQNALFALLPVLTAVLFVASPKALAGPDPAVVDPLFPEIAVFQGDQHEGIREGFDFLCPPIFSLKVNSLTADVTPASSLDGIELINTGEQALAIEFIGFNFALQEAKSIIAFGDQAQGVSVSASGKKGAKGADGTFSSGEYGKPGGAGGPVTVSSVGDISTAGNEAEPILAHSLAGAGGAGGDGGIFWHGGGGGAGAASGDVVVTGDGSLVATGENQAHGIAAASEAGVGGVGGDGGSGANGGAGGAGGDAGDVAVEGSWAITTEGNESHAIWSRSKGGWVRSRVG